MAGALAGAEPAGHVQPEGLARGHRSQAGLQVIDPFVTALYGRLAAALRAAMTAGAIPAQDPRYAALIWVTLFDERVVVDLTHHQGLSPAQAAGRLTAALLAALAA